LKKCKIVVKDEVNIKIEDLDLDVRKKLTKLLKYEIPYARHMPAVKLGRWDGCVSFFTLSGGTYLNLLPEILPVLENFNYNVEVDDQRQDWGDLTLDPVDENTFAHKTWPKGHVKAGEPVILRDYQIEVVNAFLADQQCLQEVATGAGKCQPYDSQVLTDLGWKSMGNIQVGDKVRTPDGSLSAVLNIFEPGNKDIYEITFKDGRTVRCCEDHLWPVYNIQWGQTSKKGGPIRNITTTEIIHHMQKSKRPIGIPMATFENDINDVNLPMDPWLLGFLLGDGSFRHGSVSFSTSDLEIVEKVEAKLSAEYKVKHVGNYDYAIVFKSKELRQSAHSKLMSTHQRNVKGHITSNGKSGNQHRQSLIDMGLDHKLSHEKFVPEIYFTGSLEQRLELLRGLVDSDGTIDKGSVYFTSVSPELASGFAKLVHSVGGIAKVKHAANRTYVYQGKRRNCKDSYTVATKFPEPWKLVSLQRKKQATNHQYQYGPTLKNNIVSVEKVGHEPVRCIYIDHHLHLYITDGYVVTHNTLITATLSAGVEKYGRSVVIVPNKSLVSQTEDDYRNLGLDVGVYFGDRKEVGKTHTICTWQSLNSLMKSSKGDLDGNMPAATIDDFVDGVVCVMVDECFSGDTLITTPTSKIPIQDLQPGDLIVNFCEETRTYKHDEVVQVFRNLTKSSTEPMLELVFDNGEIIKCTASHKFLTTNGWVRADQINEDTEVIDINTYR